MLAKRAHELGVPMFKILVTECFWDRMPDIEGKPPMQAMDNAAGQKVHGLLQQRAMFHDPLTDVISQLQWAENTYPDYVKGFHLFTYSKAQDWSAGGYCVNEWPEFIAAAGRNIVEKSKGIYEPVP